MLSPKCGKCLVWTHGIHREIKLNVLGDVCVNSMVSLITWSWLHPEYLSMGLGALPKHGSAHGFCLLEGMWQITREKVFTRAGDFFFYSSASWLVFPGKEVEAMGSTRASYYLPGVWNQAPWVKTSPCSFYPRIPVGENIESIPACSWWIALRRT